MSKDTIYFFNPEDENGWIANFSDHSVYIEGIKYRTVEHYFQAQKFLNEELKKKLLKLRPQLKQKKLHLKINQKGLIIGPQ